MKKFIFYCLIATLPTLTFASHNNFQFQTNQYQTKRQGGQTIDIYVRYAMKDDVDYAKYPDYRELRTRVLSFFEPSKDLPINTFWEVIAEKIGDDLMSHYSLAGVSIQILAYPNPGGNISEPGFHGPIYTVGDVIPLNQVVIPGSNPGFK